MSDDDVSKQRKTCLPHEGRSLARQMFFARTSMRDRGKNQKALGTCKIHGEDREMFTKRRFRNSWRRETTREVTVTNIKTMDVLRANTKRAQQPPEKLAPS